MFPAAACNPAKITVESASVLNVISVVPDGVKVTSLLNVVVALMPSVSTAELPSVVSPFAVSAPVKVVAPATAKALFMVDVPDDAPRLSVVAAPPIFKLVAPVLNSVAVLEVVVKSPPLIAISPEVVIFPDLSRFKTVVPEAEAVRIFWSPVSLRINNALPTSAPVMVPYQHLLRMIRALICQIRLHFLLHQCHH